jgi:predicted Zn-dependent protease with MMP-like domain
MNGFQMEDDQNVIVEHPKVEITKPNVDNQQVATKTKLDVVSEGFDNIMKLATEITEIKKMKTQGELILQKMDKDRELLMTEAQAYAEKKNADTKSVVDRMNVIRGMMQDFYAQSNQQITGEDFRVIITEIVNQMGRVENGQ